VADIEVASPHLGPSMRGFELRCKRPALGQKCVTFHANIPHAKGGPAEPPEKMYKTPPNMYEIRISGPKPANPAARNMYRTGPNMYRSA
tara:strand:+ start:5 stop:271 length:267 start_codon:yes stop_codon:yes gene_type:complete